MNRRHMDHHHRVNASFRHYKCFICYSLWRTRADDSAEPARAAQRLNEFRRAAGVPQGTCSVCVPLCLHVAEGRGQIDSICLAFNCVSAEGSLAVFSTEPTESLTFVQWKQRTHNTTGVKARQD